MKTLIVLLLLCSMSSTAIAASDACTAKVLAQAGLIKATSQDIVRTTDDALDMRLDKVTDQVISEAEQKEAAAALEILMAVRNLQQSPNDPAAPIIAELCKNKLSVQKTIATIQYPAVLP